MALREFRDSSGTDWKAWDTNPERLQASPVSERALGDLRAGWITFSSILGRRRLAPVPPDWANMSARELEKLCEAAVPTKRHSGELDTPTSSHEAVDPAITRRRASE